MTYTVKQAAELLGVGRSTVNLHCIKCGVPKHGPAYMIDKAALQKLRASIVGKPGRPTQKPETE